jgi:hypothetical protein
MALPVGSSSSSKGDARALQERLHALLSCLADTTNIIKNWGESEGDDASVHVKTTTHLMSSIQQVLNAIAQTEGVVKEDEALRQTLDECPIPLDLLDLMDHGGGLNPDCFSRGLLKEALGQLAGLKRRKLALEMLGDTIQKGMNKLDSPETFKEVKRSREDADDSALEPPAKRAATSSRDSGEASKLETSASKDQ